MRALLGDNALSDRLARTRATDGNGLPRLFFHGTDALEATGAGFAYDYVGGGRAILSVPDGDGVPPAEVDSYAPDFEHLLLSMLERSHHLPEFAFDMAKAKRGAAGKGFYFADTIAAAAGFGELVVPAFVDLHFPAANEDVLKVSRLVGDRQEDITDELRARGFDGVLWKDGTHPCVLVVFDPAQIITAQAAWRTMSRPETPSQSPRIRP